MKAGGTLNTTKHNWGVLPKRRRGDAECVHCHWKQSLNVLVSYVIHASFSEESLMQYTARTTTHGSPAGVNTSLIQNPRVSGQWAAKSCGAQFYNPLVKGQQPYELRPRSFPRQTSDETTHLANTLQPCKTLSRGPS